MSNINTLKIHKPESNKISDEEFLLMPIEDRIKLCLNCDEIIAYDDKKRKIFGLSEKAPGKRISGDSIVVESYEYPVKFQAYKNSERVYDESLVIEVLGVLDGVSVPGFIRDLCKDTYYIFSKLENLEIDQLGSAIVNLAVREALIELKKQTLGNLHNGEKPATILTADDEFPIIRDQFMNLFYYKIRKISFETITGGHVDDNTDFTSDKFFVSGFIEWAEKNKERLKVAGYNIENVIRECNQYYGPISLLLFPMVAKGLDIGIFIEGYDSYNRHFLFVDGDITAVLGKKITNNTAVERLEDIYTEVVYGGKVLENLDYYTSILIGLLKQDVSISDGQRLKDSVYTFFYLLKHSFGIVPVVSCSPIKVGSTRSQDMHEKRLVYQRNIHLSLFSDGLRYMQKNLSPLHNILIETILFSKKQTLVQKHAFSGIKVEILNLIENLKKKQHNKYSRIWFIERNVFML